MASANACETLGPSSNTFDPAAGTGALMPVKEGVGRGWYQVGPWPFAVEWELEHRDYRDGRSFTDVQVTGPFRFCQHVHRMVPQGPDACLLEDTIEYELPLGLVGRLLGQPFMPRKLRRLFAYRHAVTRQAFE